MVQIIKKKGFTLIEILIVISVISLVILIGLSSYSVVQKKIRLDLAANTVQSIINQARDKTRSGYFDTNQNILTANSYCFGFKVTEGGFIELLQTKYNRLDENIKCSTLEQDIKIMPSEEVPSDLVIKKIEQFGQPVSGSVTAFFTPPNGTPEVAGLRSDKEAFIRIDVGYANSDNILDQREVVFNVLTGGTYLLKSNEIKN